MMKIDIISAVPQLLDSVLFNSILQRGIEKELIEISVHNLRDWTVDRNRVIDDNLYGGGPGMLLKVDILVKAIKSLRRDGSLVVLTSPRGRILNQPLVRDLSNYSHIVIVCGHYKGVDERVRDYIDMEISVGDYVLTGGEIPAAIICDSVLRLVPGVMSDINSANSDSFENILLDCAHYTRPLEFEGKVVPEVLRSGNHKLIDEWRLNSSIDITKENRPDIFDKYLQSQKKFK
ncbi:MAG: tRNA (guanosine(37)-N1)-methyltransferase TrmD [Candidatus Cloacimonadota bacterium]|nr:MAG: tRNA (guanosine(37)-N1)-methyltransferase TrmD [Candidatus Cloacimonadota bacterium]PIE78825.1 MAG: tRNA (guanosine(37)-N1)-methyltransferase TrmD [Candidatus Delongbacteria bacterium]